MKCFLDVWNFFTFARHLGRYEFVLVVCTFPRLFPQRTSGHAHLVLIHPTAAGWRSCWWRVRAQPGLFVLEKANWEVINGRCL